MSDTRTMDDQNLPHEGGEAAQDQQGERMKEEAVERLGELLWLMHRPWGLEPAHGPEPSPHAGHGHGPGPDGAAPNPGPAGDGDSREGRLAGWGHGPWPNPLRGQGRVLTILALKPEIEQRDLAYMLGMSRQALGELLSKLERSGFITREPNPNDRRRMVVRLTEAGRREAGRMRPNERNRAGILDGLSPEELAAFDRALGLILDSWQERFPGSRERLEERRAAMSEFMRRRSQAGFASHAHGGPFCRFGASARWGCGW